MKYTYKQFQAWAIEHGFTQDEDIHDIFYRDGIEVGRKLDGSIFHGPKGFSLYRVPIHSLAELAKLLKDHFCMQLQ